MWKIDTGKITMRGILKPYQHGIISMLLKGDTGLGTGDIHAALNHEGCIISRASVINYCQLLEANDVIRFEERSGKGGYARIYFPEMSWESIIEFMHLKTLATLQGAFPDSGYLKETVSLLNG